MELKNFIRLALSEICDGIAEARTDIEAKYANSCIIAPVSIEGRSIFNGETSEISFDLTIQISNEMQGTAKAGGILKVINCELGGKINKNYSHLNRVTFSVPFIPQGLRTKKNK